MKILKVLKDIYSITDYIVSHEKINGEMYYIKQAVEDCIVLTDSENEHIILEKSDFYCFADELFFFASSEEELIEKIKNEV